MFLYLGLVRNRKSWMTEGSTRKERDREIDCFKVWAGLNENIFFLLEPRSLKASHHLPIVISLWRSSSPRLCLKKKPPDLSMAHRCSQGYSLQSVLPRTQPQSGGGLGKTGVRVQAESGDSDHRAWNPRGALLWPGAKSSHFQPRWTIAPSGLGGAHGSADQGTFVFVFHNENILIMPGKIMTCKIPLSNPIKFTFLRNPW